MIIMDIQDTLGDNILFEYIHVLIHGFINVFGSSEYGMHASAFVSSSYVFENLTS